MALTDNILGLVSASAQNAPKSAASSRSQRDVVDFVSEILSRSQAQMRTQTQAQDAKSAAASTAMLKNRASAADQKSDMAQKINDYIKKNGTDDKDGLKAYLQKIAPHAPAQAVDTLASLLNQGNDVSMGDIMSSIAALSPQQIQGAKAGLTSDLTSGLSTEIQKAPAPLEQKVADSLEATLPSDDAQDLAQILNNIAPGEKADIDPEIMQGLQAKFDAFKQQGGDIAQFKADVIQYLKDEHVDDADLQAYMAAFAQDLRAAAPVETTAVSAQKTDLAQAKAATLAQTALKQTQDTAVDILNGAGNAAAGKDADVKRDAQTAEKNVAATPAATTAAQATESKNTDENASRHTQLREQQQTQAQTRAQNSDAHADAAAVANNAAPQPKAATVTHPAAINAMLGAQLGAAGQDTGFGFGAGQQGAFAQQAATGLEAAGLSKPALGQGFNTYMQAANGTHTAATTQMVGIQISRNAANGGGTFTMQLNPSELGQLEVRMKFSKDGTLKAHLIADKPETLSMLQKDSSQLERILQQSGITLDDSSLSFDLRQQNPNAYDGQDRAYDGNGSDTAQGINGRGNQADAAQANIAVQAYGYITQSGVNIMV